MQTTNTSPTIPLGKAEFPADATMFYCVGAQKAGTTWLHRVLQAHPECHLPIAKEVHFFDILEGASSLERRLKRKIDDMERSIARLKAEIGPGNRAALARIQDAAAHLEVFTGAKDGSDGLAPYIEYLLKGRTHQPVICDITPAYSLLDRNTYATMASFGNARFLFVLRDPVSRIWSQIRMVIRLEMKSAGREIDGQAYAEACQARAAQVAGSDFANILRSSYLRTMDELEAAVPRDRIQYLFFEEMFEPAALDQLSKFLGISPIASLVDSKMNEGIKVSLSQENATALREKLAEQYDALGERLGVDLPQAWKRWD